MSVDKMNIGLEIREDNTFQWGDGIDFLGLVGWMGNHLMVLNYEGELEFPGKFVK